MASRSAILRARSSFSGYLLGNAGASSASSPTALNGCASTLRRWSLYAEPQTPSLGSTSSTLTVGWWLTMLRRVLARLSRALDLARLFDLPDNHPDRMLAASIVLYVGLGIVIVATLESRSPERSFNHAGHLRLDSLTRGAPGTGGERW